MLGVGLRFRQWGVLGFLTFFFSSLILCDGKEVDQFHQPSGSNEVAIANEDGISYGSELIEVDKVKINQGDLLFGGDASDGALWDIFWRQDVPKLQEYLKKNFREFRYVHCCRLKQVNY